MTDRPRRLDRAELVTAGLLAAVGAVLAWQASRMPDRGGYSGVEAADVPRLVGWVLLALAAWTVVAAFRDRPDATGTAVPRQEAGPVLWIVGGLTAQLLLLPVAGFSIATGVLFAATARAFGQRRLPLTIPVGIILALLVYGVFDQLLQLNLPAGGPERLVYGD